MNPALLGGLAGAAANIGAAGINANTANDAMKGMSPDMQQQLKMAMIMKQMGISPNTQSPGGNNSLLNAALAAKLGGPQMPMPPQAPNPSMPGIMTPTGNGGGIPGQME